MKKIFKWLGILLAAGLVAIQFMRPPRNTAPENPATDFIEQYHPPADVEGVLRVACYDCHSSNTRYPWYAEVQPVGWWINGHIEVAKKEVNFSDFGSYRVRRKYRKLEEMMKQVDTGEMPLPSYQIIHTDAKLTAAQREAFVDWVGSIRDALKAVTPADSLEPPKRQP